MNMKKTFAGAMAGALAVSAMATSASASIPGPGEYTIDLTKDAEFYATVQFTFDADYMISAKINNMADGSADKYIGINFADFSGDFVISDMKELTVDVVGSTGVKTQTLKYNTTWNDVNFYNWNLFNYGQAYAVGDKTVGNVFKLPVANNGVHADAQTLYLDKYNTVKEALAVKMADGNKKYPSLYDDANDVWVEDNDGALDFAYFDKIVVTAKIPAKKSFSLDKLNGIGGYKTKVTATIDGVHDLEIFELENDTAAEDADVVAAEKKVKEAQDVVDALTDQKTALTARQLAVRQMRDAGLVMGTAPVAPVAPEKTTILKANYGSYGPNPANPTAEVFTPATADLEIDGKDTATFTVATTGGHAKLTYKGKTYDVLDASAADVGTAIADHNADAADYATAYAKYETDTAKYDELMAIINAYDDVYGKPSTDTTLDFADIESQLEVAKAALEDAKDVLALALAAAEAAEGTFVGVDVDDAEPYTRKLANGQTITLPIIDGETLFTKFESNKVGLKTGVVIDTADNKVKTLSGDIGAWKPDALRQIADAIADNEGVTITFTAKDTFDDAAYRAWFSAVQKYGVNGTPTHVLYGTKEYGTDNVKDSYEVWGVSMFTGAIVLNRDFSKQFAESGLVDWGTNTITFDWDELTEGRFYDASIVLHSMELLSTQNAEWVSCTVTVPEQGADAEEVDPSQGAEDNSTEIDDTPVTEATEVITEAPATEAPAVTEAAPVAPVTNPTTGNAPVALAVIPVALAAAAIVAKKRG